MPGEPETRGLYVLLPGDVERLQREIDRVGPTGPTGPKNLRFRLFLNLTVSRLLIGMPSHRPACGCCARPVRSLKGAALCIVDAGRETKRRYPVICKRCAGGDAQEAIGRALAAFRQAVPGARFVPAPA